jgi:DNA-directed RNA polymerase subunit RPC12/RpoP
MAVKKVGQDESVKRRATCKNCGAKLEFYQKDVLTKSYSCMGESETYSYVVCPECNVHVVVK